MNWIEGSVTPAALPLNALRAFEASARHLNFTHAAEELCVTQGAVSHQIRALEARLGVALFRRLPRGLALTDEGVALLPGLSQSFGRMAELLDQVRGGVTRRPLVVGVVNTFAVGWLMPRLEGFRAGHPLIDLRLRTHNNKVDPVAEGLDLAIQFGDGGWPGLEATELVSAALSPLASPRIAESLHRPADLARFDLLRSYRADEWPRWFAEAGIEALAARGAVFDSSIAMALAAERGLGVALAPPGMFAFEIARRRLVQPFALAVTAGAYYLTRPRTRPLSEAAAQFAAWCAAAAAEPA
jgi:LysR family transcriptional regulator of beta-lactamase